MSQINRVPFGLQDLLGSKNFGDNPSDLGQVVAPTLEMFPFLASERLSWAITDPLPSAVEGSIHNFDVPEGELWLVDSLTVNIAPSGGPVVGDRTTVSVAFALVANSDSGIPGQGHPAAALADYVITAVGVQKQSFDHEFQRLLPLFSGSRVGFFASNVIVTAGNLLYTPAVRYYKLFI